MSQRAGALQRIGLLLALLLALGIPHRLIAEPPTCVRGVYDYRAPDGRTLGQETFSLVDDGATRTVRVAIAFYELRTAITLREASGDGEAPGEAHLRLERRWADDASSADARQVVQLWRRAGADHVALRARGDRLGTLEQRLPLPSDGALLAPAAAAAVPWTIASADASDATRELVVLNDPERPGADRGAWTHVAPVGFARGEAETVELPDGSTVEAAIWTRSWGPFTSRWWLHPRHGVPVRGQVGPGTVVLTSWSVATGDACRTGTAAP